MKAKYVLKSAETIHVDCDLHESAKEVLRFIEGMVQRGTILIFDDWHAYSGHEDENEKHWGSEGI